MSAYSRGTRRGVLSHFVHSSLGSVVAALVMFSFLRERFELWALVLTLLAFAALVHMRGWKRWNRPLVFAVAANIILVFLYLWSLDDRVHVVVQGSPSGYVATVGADTLALPNVPTAGRLGLYAGRVADYRVKPTGEAFAVAPSDPLATFGQAVRFGTPNPAWSNLVLQQAGKSELTQTALTVHSTSLNGQWTTNPRGELQGDAGSSIVFVSSASGKWTFSGDISREDGTQGLLVGVTPSMSGYLLAVRMDQPDALWLQWTGGQIGHALAGTSVHPPFTSMLQRDLRLLLGNMVAGLLLIALTLTSYPALAWLLSKHVFRRPFSRQRWSANWLATRFLLVQGEFAGVLAVIAFVLTAWICKGLLQQIPHVQDSVAYLFQAKTMALGRLSAPEPKLPQFFTEEFTPMFNGQWFGKYPPGWPALLTVGVLLHRAWLVNPALAGIDVILIYLIGREVYGRSIGLFAAVLTVTSPFFLFLGASFMAHTSELFYLSAFAYLLIRWVCRTKPGASDHAGDWKLLVPAGFLLGMAFLTREVDATVFSVPFLAVLLSRPLRETVLAARWLVAGALAPAVCLLLYNWQLTGSPLTSPYSLWWSFDRLGFGPTIGPGGFTPAQGLWNMSFNVEMLLAHLFGWPFYLTLAIAFIPFLLGRANRWDAIFALSAALVMLAYVFYWAHGVMYGPRYYYVAIPWFVLLTARGFQELSLLPLRVPYPVPVNRAASLALPSLLAVALFAYNIRVYMPPQVSLYEGYNHSSAASIDAVANAGIHHALVFVVNNPPGEWWSYGEVFSRNSPLLDGDIVYAHDLGAQDAELMRSYPGRSYYKLSGTSLRPLSP